MSLPQARGCRGPAPRGQCPREALRLPEGRLQGSTGRCPAQSLGGCVHGGPLGLPARTVPTLSRGELGVCLDSGGSGAQGRSRDSGLPLPTGHPHVFISGAGDVRAPCVTSRGPRAAGSSPWSVAEPGGGSGPPNAALCWPSLSLLRSAHLPVPRCRRAGGRGGWGACGDLCCLHQLGRRTESRTRGDENHVYLSQAWGPHIHTRSCVRGPPRGETTRSSPLLRPPVLSARG